MAVLSANPYISGAALEQWGFLLPGLRSRVDADSGRGVQQDVIDVRAKRVRVEDLATRRTDADRTKAQEAELAEPVIRGKLEAMQEFENEMLRGPFMYERSRTHKGMILKSAPIKRGIFIDTVA